MVRKSSSKCYEHYSGCEASLKIRKRWDPKATCFLFAWREERMYISTLLCSVLLWFTLSSLSQISLSLNNCTKYGFDDSCRLGWFCELHFWFQICPLSSSQVGWFLFSVWKFDCGLLKMTKWVVVCIVLQVQTGGEIYSQGCSVPDHPRWVDAGRDTEAELGLFCYYVDGAWVW